MLGGGFLAGRYDWRNAIVAGMKQLTSSLLALLSGVAATVLLAIGFNQAAQKLDPVAQKSLPISTMQTGEIASMPCMPCTNGSGGGGGSGNGDGEVIGSDHQFHA